MRARPVQGWKPFCASTAVQISKVPIQRMRQDVNIDVKSGRRKVTVMSRDDKPARFETRR